MLRAPRRDRLHEMEQRLLQAIAAVEASGRAHAEAAEARARAHADAAAARAQAHADAIGGRIREEMQAEGAKTRRHFDVVAESLRAEIKLVAEGVVTLDQKHERLRAEMHEGFARVDRRLLRLEARVLAPEERN